ncbi:MAG: nucleotidyltransferase domain-containing protein [Actinobacteria bacterium]|nr:nucleotidyltransferase domain-containing protein [Actinomycetota bacterium]
MAATVTAESLGLSEFVLGELRKVLSRHQHVRHASVFGSRARGDFTNRSDIDVLLDAPEMTFPEYLDLLADLDDASIVFGVDVIHPEFTGNTRLVEFAKREGRRILPV